MQFETADGTVLLKERSVEPRLIMDQQTWEFFEWDSSEKINAKGILPTDLLVLRAKAKYISFGGKPMRMPLVLSRKGYGLGIAAKETVCSVISKPMGLTSVHWARIRSTIILFTGRRMKKQFPCTKN